MPNRFMAKSFHGRLYDTGEYCITEYTQYCIMMRPVIVTYTPTDRCVFG